MPKIGIGTRKNRSRPLPKPQLTPVANGKTNHIAPALAGMAVDATTLVLDPDNARRHPERNLDAIRASLARYGQLKPVVVRRQTRVVVAGNGTLEAARSLGWTKIAAAFVDLTDAEAAGYGLADNRTAELAEWDLEVVQRLEALVRDAGGEAVGWSAEELRALRAMDFQAPAGDPESVPGLDDAVVVRDGDLWTLGKHRLLCGDATDPACAGRLLAGAVPLLMVTDPPYGVSYDPMWRQAHNLVSSVGAACRATGKVTADHRVDWSDAYKLFPGAVAYVWHAGVHAAAVARSLEASGFGIRSQIIWAKQILVLSRGHYHWQHEPCWYAVREGAAAGWTGDRKQTTVWDIKNTNPMGGDRSAEAGQTAHGTQKAVECMARPVRNHGRAGDAVYDPFVGSGTTLIACQQLSRRCYAIDVDPAYCQIALRRWAAYAGLDPVREDGVGLAALLADAGVT